MDMTDRNNEEGMPAAPLSIKPELTDSDADVSALERGRKAEWREVMLGENTVVLQAMARNYLGGKKVSPSKASIVSGLAAFMADPAIQNAALAMMDRLDTLIVGMLSAIGEVDKAFLQRALAGEVSYHELEYRLANLGERLLIFKTKAGAFAVNPYFAGVARDSVARADVLFGPDPRAKGDRTAPWANVDVAETEGFDRAGLPPTLQPVQNIVLIVYALLRENQDILLKGGQLSARARKRISGLLPGDPDGMGISEALLQALISARIVSKDEHGLTADFKAFAEFLVSRDGDFAFDLACVAAGGGGREEGAAIARAFAPLFAQRFAFSPAGLGRFMRLLHPSDRDTRFFEDFAAALKSFGLLEERDDTLVCSPERVATIWRSRPENSTGSISVDGTGTIHVLPSASLQNLIALLDIAVLISASGAWKVAVTRESARRAFAAGRSVEDLERLLAGMSGMPVPQTLGFDLREWESEYNSVRLFRGYVLSADPSAAKIIDQSGALARFPHEMLGEGLYYFGNVQSATIEKVLSDIGLPPPALRSSAKSIQGKAHRQSTVPGPAVALATTIPAEEKHGELGVDERARNVAFSSLPYGLAGNGAVPFEEALPSPELALEIEIAQLSLSPELRKKLEERLKRKLIYTADQLHGMIEMEKAASGSAGYRDIGFTAGGLDFNGKLRVIQTSLKAKFSRLDIRWTAEGGMISGSVRPVSLHKTEKDYILEGEDISNGDPISIRVGSMMQVSLHKGFLLGEE